MALPECQAYSLRSCTANSINSSSLGPLATPQACAWIGDVTQVPNFSLWYLYYDCLGERSAVHKREIQSFANRVGEEIRFKTLTYQEVYAQLEASNQADSEYLHYLHTRYFS